MSAVSNGSLRDRLQRRAKAVARARAFFVEKGLIEVDPPLLSSKASVDVEIDLFSTRSTHHETRYLFSSPEYPMKRLLSGASGDIFFLGHVWRDEPWGRKHSPEFLMAEWYRIGFSFLQMIEETVSFVELFVGKREHINLSYKEAFLRYASLDPFALRDEELMHYCKRDSLFAAYPIETSSRNDLLNLILGLHIEPHFPKDTIVALYHYPTSQAALARHTSSEGNQVAERFELFYGGMELANGYHELKNESEQRKRFHNDNDTRRRLGKDPYPIDENFLLSLALLPDCCGVAVGVDRLIMLQENASTIHDIMPIPWNEA